MDDQDIKRELTEAQAGIEKAREATVRRREAVMLALTAGWSKYKIAATLGVKGPSVDSIIESARRNQKEQPGKPGKAVNSPQPSTAEPPSP